VTLHQASDTSSGEEEEGLEGGFWGKGGLDARSPGGVGKDSAELWPGFNTIRDDD
jgi:hypothetical protein